MKEFERELLIRFLEIYNNPCFFGDVVSSSMVCRKNENKNKIKKVCTTLRNQGYLKHIWQERMYIGLDGFPCDEEFVPLHGYGLTENAKNLDFMREKKKELDDEFEKYWSNQFGVCEL